MKFKLIMLYVVLHLRDQSVTDGKRLPFAGPYSVYVDKWYQCPENKPTDTYGIFVEVIRSTDDKARNAYTGNFTVHAVFDDTQWVTTHLDLWKDNQWKDNALVLKFPKGACSNLRSNIPDLYEKFFKPDPSYKGPCQVNPGVYAIQNQPLNWTLPKIPFLPYGMYRARLSFGKDKETYGCTTTEFRVVPQVQAAKNSSGMS